ncbi:MAG: metallophosphoesterase family protein [Saprospiraceae bacterium]
MKNIFFTSDQHFGHKNIIKFSNRPFNSVEEMDEMMIQRWNEKVGETDEVYHLGDVGLASSGKLRKILERLNGKIYLIKGNHEKSAEACHSRFEWIKDYHELIIEDKEFERGQQMIVLFHYALREWNASHWGTYHLYGHSHGTLTDNPNALSFDIGVDCHNFYPLSYEEVKAIMKEKDWKPPFKKENR